MNPKPDKLANVQAQLLKGLNQRLYLKQSSLRPEQDLNLGSLDFKSSALTTWPCCLEHFQANKETTTTTNNRHHHHVTTVQVKLVEGKSSFSLFLFLTKYCFLFWQ